MNIDDCLCCGICSGRKPRLTCLSAVMFYEITASYYTIIIQFKVALITQFSCSMHISSGLSKSEVIQGTMFSIRSRKLIVLLFLRAADLTHL